MINFNNLLKSDLLLKIVVIFLCLTGVWRLQMPQMAKIQANQSSKEEFIRLEEQDKLSLHVWQKSPAFGFNNILADWLYLQFIQYFGDSTARSVTGYQLNPDYLEVIVQHDPFFVDAYLFGSTAVSLFAGRPDRTVEIFNQGLPHLSPKLYHAEYIWLYKGVDELLFVGDSEQARQSYLKASEWGKIAGNQRLAMRAQETADFLAKNSDSRSAQASAWALLYSNAKDDSVRKLAIDNIIRLGGKINSAQNGAISIQLPKVD